jgi:hypothetical protein
MWRVPTVLSQSRGRSASRWSSQSATADELMSVLLREPPQRKRLRVLRSARVG